MATHKGAEHHKKAAEHHELAAKHHREAAKHHEAGSHGRPHTILKSLEGMDSMRPTTPRKRPNTMLKSTP